MNIHDFPSVYEAQAKADAEKTVQLLESAHHLKAGEYAKKTFEINRQIPASSLTGIDSLLGFLITSVLILLIFYGIFGAEPKLYMILLWIAGTVIFGLVVNNMRRKYVRAQLTALENEMEEGKKKLSADIDAVRREAAEESEAYRFAFEEKARQMSLRFAESELADQVVDWAMAYLSEVIDSADRSAHIEQITVTAMLGVYPTQILFSASEDRTGCPGFTSGAFDFEKNRCRNLTTPLEQAALAHVLASKVQLAVMMKYPQDPSGSVPDVTALDLLVNKVAGANIKYHAANLNYQAVKNW